MPREVNQENVRLLIPGKAACVAAIIAEKRNILPQEALLAFYRSRTYALLEIEASKYWHYSPEQLFAVSGFSRRQDCCAKHGRGHSVLEPFQKEILNAWKMRKSAREIAVFLAAHGVKTTPQNVWKFIKRRTAVKN